MRILYVAGNPALERKLELEKEIDLLQREIDDAQRAEPIEFKPYPNCRIEELPSIISRVQPDVIHFSGHGNETGIILRDEADNSVSLSGDALAKILVAMDVRPALIVVNTCNSEKVASELVVAADFVIGTNAPIRDPSARAMAANLYQRLARGASLHSAFSQAEQMLTCLSRNAVKTKLLPEEAHEQARKRVLAEPFRIVARLPMVDKALRAGLNVPGDDFDEGEVLVKFGVAGAPSGTTQLVFFTDNEDVSRPSGMSEEELKSWIITKRPVDGEIWTKPSYLYAGDIQWYATVVTGGRLFFTTASTTSRALKRYYFDEVWRGDLPDATTALVHRVIERLGERSGSRRMRRQPRARMPEPSIGEKDEEWEMPVVI